MDATDYAYTWCEGLAIFDIISRYISVTVQDSAIIAAANDL